MVEEIDAEAFRDLKDSCERALVTPSLSTIKQMFEGASDSISGLDDRLAAVITDDLDHLMKSRSVERARYYARAIIKDLDSAGSLDPDQLNVKLWKGYDHIMTDSLWILGKRVREAKHGAWYWGNFVPQIPYQMMARYSSPGDWILDPFCGSGTTLLEAIKMRRNSVGIELNPEIIQRTGELVNTARVDGITSEIVQGDSTQIDLSPIMQRLGIGSFDLAIVHPPYWDIVPFSDSSEDLSNSKSLEDFLQKFSSVARKTVDVLKTRGHLALVIGDAYRQGEIVPLGFRCMDVVASMGTSIKGIIVKDIQNTRAKRNSENLWRYRALKSGFYVFRHEYVFVFQKN